MVFKIPNIYQEDRDEKKPVEGRFVKTDDKEFGFEVAGYDKTKPLVIDPALDYSTYLGGSADDEGYGIAVDPNGDALVTGYATSANFPIAGTVPQSSLLGGADAFVSKFSPDGERSPLFFVPRRKFL